MEYTYTIQVSLDNGDTWKAHDADPAGTVTTDEDAGRFAADLLDAAYRHRLDGDGVEPLGVLQVYVWEGPAAQGTPLAHAGTGTDWQWAAYARLLSEISGDIAAFEDEKKEARAAATLAQNGIVNSRRRMEQVVHAATRTGMPQVSIANAAGRTREWVRRTTDTRETT